MCEAATTFFYILIFARILRNFIAAFGEMGAVQSLKGAAPINLVSVCGGIDIAS